MPRFTVCSTSDPSPCWWCSSTTSCSYTGCGRRGKKRFLFKNIQFRLTMIVSNIIWYMYSYHKSDSNVIFHHFSTISFLLYQVKNLRSQVSRAGIYTLGDMFTCLAKNMDLVCFLFVDRVQHIILKTWSYTNPRFGRTWSCSNGALNINRVTIFLNGQFIPVNHI
jgi:hypothetical protein